MTPADLVADRWAFGPWCWVVDRVASFGDVPYPCRGMQGLWPIPTGDLRDCLFDLVGEDVRSAITLLQPYASAIAIGPKRIENRPWRRLVPPGGVWVGLHAGVSWYAHPTFAKRSPGRTVAENRRAYSESLLDVWRDGMVDYPSWPNAPTTCELPLGCMLGAMHVREILRYPDAGGELL